MKGEKRGEGGSGTDRGVVGGVSGAPDNRRVNRGYRRASRLASFEERISVLHEDLRKPAVVLLRRRFGSAFESEELEDIYSTAWCASLEALGERAREMSDEDLRAYVLTAVIRRGQTEGRRRRRKPSEPIEPHHEAISSDPHLPTPDELAERSEADAVVADVLAGLPERRRAVILLRYGWGLKPAEVCDLVEGLSPRAYRKEVTRGVEQVVAAFADAESGALCDRRAESVRELIEGRADPDADRQARAHLVHCSECRQMAKSLDGRMRDLGSSAGLAAVAGSLGPGGGSILEWLRDLPDRMGGSLGELLGREAQAAEVVGGGLQGAGGVASGGALAAIGGGGAKLAAVCAGGAAAATCGAAAIGALPVGLDPLQREPVRAEKSASEKRAANGRERALEGTAFSDRLPVSLGQTGATSGGGGAPDSAALGEPQEANGGAPASANTVGPAVDDQPSTDADPVPSPPPEQQEFTPTAAIDPAPESEPAAQSSDERRPSKDQGAREFGP